MLSILLLILGFLLGMILEAKWKSHIQEKIWKELNDLAESMEKLAKTMIKSQNTILNKMEDNKNENNR